MSGGGHPTDADRELRAAPVVAAAMRALRQADGAALAALLRDDAAWLAPDGRFDGPAGAEGHARAVATAGREWADPQFKGAHAVLRWSDIDGGRGALVVEVRGEHLVLVCETP